MKNIARNCKFNININFEKSHDSYIFDTNTQKKYLDFFGMYASLPLGYNHKIFKSEQFKKEILRASTFKVNNCEFTSNETLEFDSLFSNYAGKGKFVNFHYTCTGSLAIEAAIKVCIHHSGYKTPNILSFKNSFHGINSFSAFITDRFCPVNLKLEGLPEPFSSKLPFDLNKVEDFLKKNNITCVLVEPIQCSFGDSYHNKYFWKGLRKLCDQFNVPLVFDEIQVGFGSTGKLWFFEHIDIIPDIVVFGKKTQLSGIMVNAKYNGIFDKEYITKLEVTWDSDILDMIRCKYIIRVYKEGNILNNVLHKGNILNKILKSIDGIKNIRSLGLMAAFDFDSSEKREQFIKQMYYNGMLCNSTGNKSVRLRPNLAIDNDELERAKDIIQLSCKGIL